MSDKEFHAICQRAAKEWARLRGLMSAGRLKSTSDFRAYNDMRIRFEELVEESFARSARKEAAA